MLYWTPLCYGRHGSREWHFHMKRATPWNGIEFERTVLSGIFYNIRKITTESFDNYDHKTTLHYFSSTYHFQNQLVTTIVLSLSLSFFLFRIFSISSIFPFHFSSTNVCIHYPCPLYFESTCHPKMSSKIFHSRSIQFNPNYIPYLQIAICNQFSMPFSTCTAHKFHINHTIQYHLYRTLYGLLHFFFLAIIFTFQIYNHIDNTTWKCPFKIHSVSIPCVIPSIFYSN